MVLHAAGVLMVVVVPLLMSEPLPAPASRARAFFVEPVSVSPPPPPPPPAARPSAPQTRPTPAPLEPAAFTAPVETPTDVKPEEGIDLGIQGGVSGGVEGGVPGGVVGGVVGGVPDAPPPPTAVRVGGAIREPKQLKHVAPEYPALAKRTSVEGVVILECTISPAGRVTDVRVLRGIPMLDDAAIEAVRQWVFTPTLLDGVPVPVIMTVTVNFSLKKGSGIIR
jgi:protein TonB